MEDRFKFRAWNKLSNEMKDVISLNINYEFPDCSNVILETNTFDNIKTHNNPITCANGLNNVVLMQCTGLKDKNGKLIYEGDIVRFEETYECACFTNIKEVLFKIVWNDYTFKAKQIKIIQGNKSYEFPLTLSKLLEIVPYTEHQTTINLEVIGNIYENKELLESEG